jgi:hypothetical protein
MTHITIEREEAKRILHVINSGAGELRQLGLRLAGKTLEQALAAPVQECLVHGECFGGKCIYTTPPAAKRQWVGLTDEEMYLNCPNWLSHEQCKVWIQQIEAKLKEKNT